jgi:hypothetical protein
MRCMRISVPEVDSGGVSEVPVSEWSAGRAVENSGSDGLGTTEEDALSSGTRLTGRQPAPLRRGTQKNRVRGFETRRRLVELHCFEGKRLVECAREMGLSYGRVLAVWRGIVDEVCADGPKAEELRHNVRTYSDRVLRHLIEKSIPLVENSAAHGAVALKALESLCRLHGVAAPDPAEKPTCATMAEVGATVRAVSPLLAAKLDRVRALRVDGPAQSMG